MADTNCKFCNRLRDDIENMHYHTEQARKNGRNNVDDVVEKYVAAYCHQSYIDDIPCGRMTVIFDELNFCPICGNDIKPLIATV